MTHTIETEKEVDGRWLAEIRDLPGVMAYGETKEEAMTKVEALALRVTKVGLTPSKLQVPASRIRGRIVSSKVLTSWLIAAGRTLGD